MLPAPHRLRKSSEIERVWKRGRSFFSPEYQLKIMATGNSVSRFAVIVGTKVSKLAVRRNLVKRRTREIIRHHLAEIRSGFDLLVSIKKPALEADFAALEVSLLRTLSHAGLVKKI